MKKKMPYRQENEEFLYEDGSNSIHAFGRTIAVDIGYLAFKRRLGRRNVHLRGLLDRRRMVEIQLGRSSHRRVSTKVAVKAAP